MGNDFKMYSETQTNVCNYYIVLTGLHQSNTCISPGTNSDYSQALNHSAHLARRVQTFKVLQGMLVSIRAVSMESCFLKVYINHFYT